MITLMKLNETVRLVEARLSDGTSEDPVKDLHFLADQYNQRGEWDKANAASRQMLRVAEGASDFEFAVTPVDIDLMLDKKRLKRHCDMRAWKLIGLLLAFEAVVGIFVFTTQRYPDLLADITPWNHYAVLVRAMGRLHETNFAGALADCDQVLSASPKNPRAISLKAAILFDQGDTNAALSEINKLKSLDREAFSLKSNILFRLGDHEGIRRRSNEVFLAGNEGIKYEALKCSAVVNVVDGNYRSALTDAQHAASLAESAEEKSDCQLLLSRVLLHLNCFEDAERCANVALQAGVNRGDAYLYRGEARLGMKEYKSALNDANSALWLLPKLGRAYELRSSIRTKLGDTQSAAIDQRLAQFYKSSPSRSY